MGRVNARMRLPGGVDCGQEGEVGPIRCAIDGVTIKSDDIVRVLRWIS